MRLHIMRNILSIAIGVGFLIGVTGICDAAPTYSIPAEKVDVQKVYFGQANGFEKAGKVDYDSVVKATPEYAEVKRKRIEPGTGKYWILLSQASERAVRAISEVGHETGYDFIAAQAYLGNLEPSIPSEDITPLVVDRVKDNGKVKEESKPKEEAKGKAAKRGHQ